MAVLVFLGCAPAANGPGTKGNMWTDITISMSIKETLSEDVWVSSRKIDVDTVRGHVTLGGVVTKAEEARRAVMLAKRVRGVKSVRNNLQVGSKTIGQGMDDSVIHSRIRSQLLGEPKVRSFSIDIDVERGVVTLGGLVDDASQKARILEITEKTEGVVRVVDNLQVR